MCVKDVEFGRPLVGADLVVAFRITEGVALVELTGIDGPLIDREAEASLDGFGVVLRSADGNLILLGGFIGVFICLGAVPDASEMGGEGGVGVSDTVSVVETDFVSGGVVTNGDEAAELGDPSKEGELGAVISVDMVWRFRAPCFLSLSCMISTSILRSDSSSLNLCVSIRRFSRSRSPILISSSIITARSMATLCFDSKSSSDDDVLRACLSKSSLATSISRSFICRVRLESRKVVISLCNVFCAVFASALACLYLV
jgi:hypothetical protein